MSFQLRHPDKGSVTIDSEMLRDRYLRRGFVQVTPVTERSYRQLQEVARERGIPANQSRAELEKALG